MERLNSARTLESVHSPDTDLEPRILAWGERIFADARRAEGTKLFGKRSFAAALMDWAMKVPEFKVQLFRFVDVLPMLTSSREIAEHLEEYLGEKAVRLPGPLRIALKAGRGASWILGRGVKRQVAVLARQFIVGAEEKEVLRTLTHLRKKGVGFTVDLLGEAVVNEAEADEYAGRCLALLDLLARRTSDNPEPNSGEDPAQAEFPRVNLSIKVSALYSQIHPTDPDTAVARISDRLRPILRRAAELGAFINFDMEHYALKNLTLRLFKELLSEAEFIREPACGLALQAYLRDSEEDLEQLLAWARVTGRRFTVRLVKGAYWDYETVIADQKRWPVPVFSHKSESDANFEKLALGLLEHLNILGAAFGTHNVRSIAFVLAQAERLRVPTDRFEFQMLRGMADGIKEALVECGCRVREYCPVGELLPGMAYLVRRLLENTSNEGFLAQASVQNVDLDALLRAPTGLPVKTSRSAESLNSPNPLEPFDPSSETVHSRPADPGRFRNEPPVDFTVASNRERLSAALTSIRSSFGQRHALIINNAPVETAEWLPSLNPANQREVIGYAALASISLADAALEAAHSASPHWARTPAAERARLLEQLAQLIRRDKETFTALEILEAGKSWTEADADVAEAIDFCGYYAWAMRQFGLPARTQAVSGERNVQEWWPRGIGLVIAPWNFPLAILTGMTAAAVVTGNAVVMKPSDQTPVIASHLARLFVAAGFPEGVVNLLTGPGSTVGAHLVSHPKVDFIAFTGSKEVGLRIHELAGRTLPGQRGLKKVICEMGGKNAIIVDRDADLDEAVAGCIASAFGYQGQKCSALSRLIVVADVYDLFFKRFLAAAASLRIGPAEVPGTVLGPVISRDAQTRILKAIDAGRAEAHLAWQGEVPEEAQACYVPPTLFTGVPATSRLFQEEIFGPVLAITKANDFDQALALANASEFALTGGIYSRHPSHLARAEAEFVCGNLYLNRPITGAVVQRQPFGGFKLSGGGTKAGGFEYLQNFLLPRVVTENCLRRGFAPDLEA